MAFELSVNIEYMFQEAGERLEDRIAAAAAAGYRKVEMFFTSGRDVPSLAKALSEHGVQMMSLLADPRTQLFNKETHGTFRDLFRQAAEDAVTLGCPNVVVGSGPGVPFMKRAVQLANVAEAVAGIVPIAEELGVTAILEAVNTRVDHPGVLFSQTEDAVSVINAVQSPRVRLLYDLYHSIVEGEDPAEQLAQHASLIEHIQIADAPGRGQPGAGAQDWSALLGLIRKAGYTGVIGVECYPTLPSTPDALAYIRDLAATA
jgi:hydroxypyruvate isomerase